MYSFLHGKVMAAFYFRMALTDLFSDNCSQSAKRPFFKSNHLHVPHISLENNIRKLNRKCALSIYFTRFNLCVQINKQ